MKNLVKSVIPLVLGVAIGFLICKYMETTTDAPPNTITVEGNITTSEAVALHKEYVRHERVRDNCVSQVGNQDIAINTEFVWFSFEEMKKYMDFLETVQYKNPDNKKISGIRVYFGKHRNHADYPNQNTVFFTPTIEIEGLDEHHNMRNLPFKIMPKGDDPLVGDYKIVRGLLIDSYLPNRDRANDANKRLGLKVEKQVRAQKMVAKSAAMEDDGNGDQFGGDDDGDGTSLSKNEGQLSPPPPRG